MAWCGSNLPIDAFFSWRYLPVYSSPRLECKPFNNPWAGAPKRGTSLHST